MRIFLTNYADFRAVTRNETGDEGHAIDLIDALEEAIACWGAVPVVGLVLLEGLYDLVWFEKDAHPGDDARTQHYRYVRLARHGHPTEPAFLWNPWFGPPPARKLAGPAHR